ncbi:MAG: GNAT family N-acetyltransferase [Mycobacterium sp.]|jgi:CRP-like cAMP-binding protein
MTAERGDGLASSLEQNPELVALRAEGLAEMALFEDCSAEQLEDLASRLRPLRAEADQVLMRQGEQAVSFILIKSGRAGIIHTGDDGSVVLDEVSAGVIVGEIALLRDKPRTATVTAVETLTGYIGDEKAFGVLADLPGVSDRLLRTARQRLAAFVTPIPVLFKDDTELLLRPVLPGDSERSTHPAVQFSTETLYRRFMSTRAPSPALMDYLFQVDYVDHFVWVLVNDADGPVVADVRFVREIDDPSKAEIAFIVADDYQGLGIGNFLMAALSISARVGGVRLFTARLLAENVRMRAILDKFGAEYERDEPGVVLTEFSVPDPEQFDMDPAIADQIRSVTRQVLRAVG